MAKIRRPLKVAIWSTNFAPRIGGIETFVLQLATAATHMAPDIDITVLTKTPPGTLDDSTFPFSVRRKPALLATLALLRRADVLHVSGVAIPPLVLGTLMRKPIALEHHGFQSICPNGQMLNSSTGAFCSGHFMGGRHGECIRCNRKLGVRSTVRLWILTFVRRWLCKHVDSNVVPTDAVGSILGLPRSVTIRHCVGVTPQIRDETPGADYRFAFVGRLVDTKGLDIAIDASRRLKREGHRFRLAVIGDGPEYPRLRQMVAEASLERHITFLGSVTDSERESALARVDALIMPSIAGEVFGLAAAEHMARGGLVIASALEPLREVVGSGGLLFEPGCADDLAEKMILAMRRGPIVADLKREAINRALALFSPETCVREHLALWHRLASGTNGQTKTMAH